MGVLLFLVFGLIVGLLARAIMPGTQRMGIGLTMLLGVAGSFIGGFLASLITNHRVMDFHTSGLIGSILGALVLLMAAGGLRNRRLS
jgi:uncharacterized membrane protein YeaQ/YmgE (transglycosylase-associated protein family)